MKRKHIITLCIVIILSLFATACGNNKIDNISDESKISSDAKHIGLGEKSFVFIVVDAAGSKTVFNISTNKKMVGEALKEHNLIDGEEGQFGLYVKTVNNITYDYDKDGKYWAFYIDGKYAVSGIDKTEIKNGSTYMLKAE